MDICMMCVCRVRGLAGLSSLVIFSIIFRGALYPKHSELSTFVCDETEEACMVSHTPQRTHNKRATWRTKRTM